MCKNLDLLSLAKKILVFWGSYWQLRPSGFLIRFFISMKEIIPVVVDYQKNKYNGFGP